MKDQSKKQVTELEPKPLLAEVTNCKHPLEALDYRKPIDNNLTMECTLCGKSFT